MFELIVVKLGGSKGINLENIVEEIAFLSKTKKIVLVHGASSELNELQEKLNVPIETLNTSSCFESRKTSRKVMELFEMAYCGKVNKRLVEMFQQKSVNAVGLSGLDGRIFEAKRNSAIRVFEKGKKKIIKGDLSGRTIKANAKLVNILLDNGFLPVLTPPAISTDNLAVNVDGDLSSAVLASELKAKKLILLSNVPGLLRDINNEDSLIEKVSLKDFDAAQDIALGRMKKKVLAAKNALNLGVETVVIASANTINPIQFALNKKGTVFENE